jgi:cysteine desulfuration protein SufE
MNEKMNRAQEEIVEEFERFDDWFEAYQYIINLGKNLETMDETMKNDEYSIGGCQSQVWLHAERISDTVHFTADSDSLLVKGLISLIFRVVNDSSLDDIKHCDLYFLDKIGLSSHLSPSRSNGLHSIIHHIQTVKNIS